MAPLLGAFFVSTLLSACDGGDVPALENRTALNAESQVSRVNGFQSRQSAGRPVEIDKIIDGDTVRLHGGDLVRLIGINTPEKKRKGKAAEPLALEARLYLEELLGRGQSRLLEGAEPRDRHGRRLGYLFAGDVDVQEQILRRGLASLVAIPPNIRFVKRYQAAEAEARREKRGLWGHDYFRPQKAAGLDFQAGAFRFVEGKIRRTGSSRKYVYLDLEKKFSIAIPHDSWDTYFGVDPRRFVGKRIIVRGWLSGSAADPLMRIFHPAMLAAAD